MTEQLQLFSGPLIRIRRRRIKVGGGHLYSCYCGVAIMRDGSGNFVALSLTLYVPGLGVNLQSGKPMCEMGLHGSSNQHSLYMQDNHGRIMIEAPERGGVYIVKHIAKGLNEFALMSAMHSPPNPEIALPATVLNANSRVQTHEFSAQAEPLSFTNAAPSDENAKIYRLRHLAASLDKVATSSPISSSTSDSDEDGSLSSLASASKASCPFSRLDLGLDLSRCELTAVNLPDFFDSTALQEMGRCEPHGS